MNKTDQMWSDDWRKKVFAQVRLLGYETIGDYFARHPGKPIVALADTLKDVAGLQLERLYFEEVRRDQSYRAAAMDSLVRDLNQHLLHGWKNGARDDFDTSGAYADWITRLSMEKADLKAKADAVWEALESLSPPRGWSPLGPDDELIIKAFATAWPAKFH
jgi:hypothetical protein